MADERMTVDRVRAVHGWVVAALFDGVFPNEATKADLRDAPYAWAHRILKEWEEGRI